jgi:hypothetical protein
VSAALGTGLLEGRARMYGNSCMAWRSRKTTVRSSGVRMASRVGSPSWISYGPGYGLSGFSRASTICCGPPVITERSNDRAMPYLTSFDVMGSPFSKRTPSRRVNVQVLPPSSVVPRSVARSGTSSPVAPGSVE